MAQVGALAPLGFSVRSLPESPTRPLARCASAIAMSVRWLSPVFPRWSPVGPRVFGGIHGSSRSAGMLNGISRTSRDRMEGNIASRSPRPIFPGNSPWSCPANLPDAGSPVNSPGSRPRQQSARGISREIARGISRDPGPPGGFPGKLEAASGRPGNSPRSRPPRISGVRRGN